MPCPVPHSSRTSRPRPVSWATSSATATRGATGHRSIVRDHVVLVALRDQRRRRDGDYGGPGAGCSRTVATRGDGELDRTGHVEVEWALPRRSERGSVGGSCRCAGHPPRRRERVSGTCCFGSGRRTSQVRSLRHTAASSQNRSGATAAPASSTRPASASRRTVVEMDDGARRSCESVAAGRQGLPGARSASRRR